MDYVAIIHKDPDSDFGVGFAGCITARRTLGEAKEMALIVVWSDRDPMTAYPLRSH